MTSNSSSKSFNKLTTKGRRIIQHEQFEFIFKRHNIFYDTYKCRSFHKEKCPAFINVFKNGRIDKGAEHNHDSPSMDNAVVEEAINKMKNGIILSSTTTSSVIRDVIFEMPLEEMSRLPSEESLKQTLRRHFNKYYKKNSSGMPEDLVEHMLYDSGMSEENRVLIFGHKEMGAALESSDIWMAEGIYTATPTPFYQLYVLHFVKNGAAHAAVFGLLTGKTVEMYTKFLQVTKEKFNISNRSRVVLVNFESAAINAFQAVFPESRLLGCFFHFKQAIIKSLQRYALKTKYEKDPQFRKNIKLFFALSMLPLDDVKKGYEAVSKEIAGQVACKRFVKYFHETFMSGGLFPPSFWNHRQSVLEGIPKATNFIEGWHNGLTYSFGLRKRPLFQFLVTLHKEMEYTRTKFHNPSPPSNKKKLILAKKLKKMIQAYDPQTSNTMFFLKAVTYVV
ncbi:uncharacterized protein LOC129614388 [Condylostylus longicornis]|uniref:uncharacterized protein LOC129614388 n=1 Tax=Condylostylus longicornis TaxID=2530218 RepID=UPI00244DC5AE|nr:uncharacterized protein LOC129614388 [Condylostylus longicornis]